MTGPYREQAHEEVRTVPVDEMGLPHGVRISLQEASTALADGLSAKANEIAKMTRAVGWWSVPFGPSGRELCLQNALELAADLDDIRQRLMVLTTRAARLASGEEKFVVRLPEEK